MSNVYRWRDIPTETTESDEEFIACVYNTILGREPDDEGLQLKLIELRNGKTRQRLIEDVLESRESCKRVLAEIAKCVRQSKGV